VNYLFDSLPPRWQPKHQINVLNVESIFDRLMQFEGSWKLVKSLAAFLRSNPDPTLATRDLRDAISQAIALQLVTFQGSVRAQQSPGWSAHADCKLAPCEQLWLDAERVELAEKLMRRRRTRPSRPHTSGGTGLMRSPPALRTG